MTQASPPAAPRPRPRPRRRPPPTALVWARWIAGRLLDTRAWRPTRASLVWSQRPWGRSGRPVEDLAVHRRAAADWLARAQDATGDGGVAAHYSLESGWASSYPETTGYAIPTLLALAAAWGEPEWTSRAAQAVRFLAGVQLDSGAFPAGEVAVNRTAPSVFNTAQILGGLLAWHRATGDADTRDRAARAASWLCQVQEADGAWHRHTYGSLVTTYTAHASCWLAEWGAYAHDAASREAAARHLDWVLARHDPATGWFDLAGFSAAHHRAGIAVTHTIAYTIAGVARLGRALSRPDALAAARRAAGAVAEVVEREGWLPGLLDRGWRPRAKYACLTGNAQMALIWLDLFRETGEERWRTAARRALTQVQQAQALESSEGGLRGGIPGSDPIWGGYMYCAFPNWAAKFFIDACLAMEATEASRSDRPARPSRTP